MARPRKHARGDTRGRILKAAIDEFASRGYDAAGVDRIARRARVNKALIYYYFANKRGLYHEILQASLQGMVAPLRLVVDGPDDANVKLAAYIDTLVEHLDRHPHLPPIMLRELADGGRHLDVETLRQMLTLPPLLFRLVGQGRQEGAFGPFDPLMLHFVLMGTAMLMASNVPIRRRVRQLGLAQPPLDTAATTALLQAVARRTLRKDHTDASTAH
ncbi:MAG: TetR/AcrR family transcriptional regulator [Vicinamibacteria bacterium]|nr:TetR/AcrR family transcriptional regulator [Vicinamibacteria bacterium]